MFTRRNLVNINIISSSNSEINNKHVFDLLKNRDKSKQHIIIAPDRSQFSLEQRLFDETGEKCFFDINIISLSRLSKLILNNTTAKILSKQSGVALVKKILEDNRHNLHAFKKATDFMGFASNLFETICFYKSCNISPSNMYVDDSMSFSNLKQKDIKLVYEEYEKYLQNDFTDSFNQLKLFAEKINAETFPNTIFYFIEFDDFTRLMYEIIAKIARFSDGIYISCVYGKGKENSNIYSNKVYYDLIDLFKLEGLDYKIHKLNGFNRVDLDLLSQNLLAFNPKQVDLTNSNITINSFDSIEHEVKFVLADIYSNAMLNKKDFSNYTIVVPSLVDYKNLLVGEIAKYDIPYYIDESLCLIDNYIIRILFEMLQIIRDREFKLSDFANIIKSPLLNFDQNSVCEYDNKLRKIGAISDMCLNEHLTEDQELMQFISMIRSFRDKSVGCKTFNDCVIIVKELFDYINIRAIDYINTLTSLEIRSYNQVLGKFENINKDICSVFGSVNTSFIAFVEIYKSYYESTSISLPPITSNTLFIADFNASYINVVDNLYILGNNEGRLPKMKLDNGLVTDEELSQLPNSNKLSPTIAMLNSRKVYKLFELVFKYKDRLVLSYLNNSYEGKLYPNNLINSFNKIGSIKNINQSNVLDVINRNYNLMDDNNVIFNNLTPIIASENITKYLSDWEVFNNNLNYRSVVSSLYSVIPENTRNIVDGINIMSSVLLPLKNHNYFKTGYSSVSQIEAFNACPYLHFGRYGLRLKEAEENALKPNDIGNIIHEVLSVVVPKILLGKYDIVVIQQSASDVLDKVLKKEEYKDIIENKSNNFVIKALYSELNRIVNAVFKEIKTSNFKPKYFEYKFDNLIVDGIRLKGFIDRIDVCKDDFIIIDYKTGDSNFKNYNDVVSGKKLQLLVYANAYAKQSGLTPNGAFYLPLSNVFGEDSSYKLNGVMLKSDDNIVNMDSGLSVENYKSDVINLKTTSTGKIYENNFYKNLCLSREDFDYLLSFAMEQVFKAVVNIKKGVVSPHPLKDKLKSTCDYCAFKALCNYNGDNNNEIIIVENITKLKEIGDVDGGI